MKVKNIVRRCLQQLAAWEAYIESSTFIQRILCYYIGKYVKHSMRVFLAANSLSYIMQTYLSVNS